MEIGFLSSCLSVRSQIKALALRSAPGNRSGRLGFTPTTDTFGRKEKNEMAAPLISTKIVRLMLKSLKRSLASDRPET